MLDAVPPFYSRSAARAQGPGQPRRALGLRQAVAIGVGGTVGGGIFVLVGVAAVPLAFAASAALIVASGRTGIGFGIAWLAAGALARALWTRARSHEQQAPEQGVAP